MAPSGISTIFLRQVYVAQNELPFAECVGPLNPPGVSQGLSASLRLSFLCSFLERFAFASNPLPAKQLPANHQTPLHSGFTGTHAHQSVMLAAASLVDPLGQLRAITISSALLCFLLGN